MPDTKKVCLVIGAGDDTGGAIARSFPREGLTACLVRRPARAEALEDLTQSIQENGRKAVAVPTY